jgi:uncharacterized RDD family membrane protein YckC
MSELPDSADDAFSPYAAPQSGVAEPVLPAPIATGEVVYAPMWARVAAGVIDLALMTVLSLVAAMLSGLVVTLLMRIAQVRPGSSFQQSVDMALWLVPVVVSLGYLGWLHSSGQATLGKMAMGIKLVRGNGAPVTFRRAIVRALLVVVSVLPLGAGVLMGAVTPGKRGLHDWLCDTRVVDRWAYTAYPQRQRQHLGAAAWVTLLLAAAVLALLSAKASGIL